MHVRTPSFDRARSSDSKNIIFEVLTCHSSIVRTRKRKLRELFAVATTTDGVPKHSLADPDVQPPTPAELDFLQHCDIAQYVPTLCLLSIALRVALPISMQLIHEIALMRYLQGQEVQRACDPDASTLPS